MKEDALLWWLSAKKPCLVWFWGVFCRTSPELSTLDMALTEYKQFLDFPVRTHYIDDAESLKFLISGKIF